MKRIGILGLGVVLTAGLIAAPAQAKPRKVRVDTGITASWDGGDNFVGQLSAAKPRCLRDRHVDVIADRSVGPDFTYGAGTRSEDDGSWVFDPPGKITGGPHFATVEKRKIKKRRNGEVKKIIVCKAGVSPEFEVH